MDFDPVEHGIEEALDFLNTLIDNEWLDGLAAGDAESARDNLATALNEYTGKPRTLDEIGRELFSHSDFVVGNFLGRQHVKDEGFDPDKLGDMEWAAEPIANEMWECVQTQVQASEG